MNDMTTSPHNFYSLQEIKNIQDKKLRELLIYLKNNSSFYQQLFSTNKIKIENIKSSADLALIPTTSKDDLQKYPEQFVCVSKNRIAEYMTTSGTLGSPVTVALSDNDLQRLAYNEFSSFLCAGCSSEDIIQLMVSLDRQFMAGIAYYSGVRKLGASVIRLGAVNPSMQIQSIMRHQPTVLIAVPSMILKLIEFAEKNNSDLNSFSANKIICIGENIRDINLNLNSLGKKITQKWKVDLFSTYASTEMQTAFTECTEQCGGHLQPELLIVEVLDENGKQVEAGSQGEVTVTTLGVEAMPLLRYRTGDICTYYNEPCKCGRNSLRLSPVVGRRQQLIKLKGTTFYPPAISGILDNINSVANYYIEIFTNEINTDEVILNIVHSGNQQLCDDDLRNHLQSGLRVLPQIKYISADEMISIQCAGESRKASKFIDRRKQFN